jgi:hypothetical protein
MDLFQMAKAVNKRLKCELIETEVLGGLLSVGWVHNPGGHGIA